MQKGRKIVHWTPRIICIVAILFLSLFALDSFSPDLTIWQQLKAFLIHLIPSFVLTGILIVAWKREFLGGLIFALVGLGFSPYIFIFNYHLSGSVGQCLLAVFTINFPFVLVGILFILSHLKKGKQKLD